jgi:nucleoid DNA-binding protein
MLITREMLIKRLAEKSGFYQKDIKHVLHSLDDVVLDCFNEVTDEEDISIQLITGCKIGCSIVPLRERINPKTQKNISIITPIPPKIFKAKNILCFDSFGKQKRKKSHL